MFSYLQTQKVSISLMEFLKLPMLETNGKRLLSTRCFRRNPIEQRSSASCTLTKTFSKNFARLPKSFFKIRNHQYDIVHLHKVSPKKAVPDYIQKPPYAVSGLDLDAKDYIEILEEQNVEHMRQSCSLARIVLDTVSKFINVGVSTDELDSIAHETCLRFKAYPSPLNYRGFPKSICTSVNNVACHGIPDSRLLKSGDIISIDISVFYNGFHGDCAATYAVGDVDAKGQKLLDVSSLCLQEAIKICHHGQDFCEIGKKISNVSKTHGFSVIPAFCGHGINQRFHCLPNILHYENDDEGKMLKGMIFTIEPVIGEGRPDIVILEDGWTAATEDDSRSAQFEHTLLVTEQGAEVLTVPGVFNSG